MPYSNKVGSNLYVVSETSMARALANMIDGEQVNLGHSATIHTCLASLEVLPVYTLHSDICCLIAVQVHCWHSDESLARSGKLLVILVLLVALQQMHFRSRTYSQENGFYTHKWYPRTGRSLPKFAQALIVWFSLMEQDNGLDKDTQRMERIFYREKIYVCKEFYTQATETCSWPQVAHKALASSIDLVDGQNAFAASPSARSFDIIKQNDLAPSAMAPPAMVSTKWMVAHCTLSGAQSINLSAGTARQGIVYIYVQRIDRDHCCDSSTTGCS